MALRWALDSGLVSCAIVGIKTVQQLRENLGVFGWRIDDDAGGERAGRSTHPPRSWSQAEAAAVVAEAEAAVAEEAAVAPW